MGSEEFVGMFCWKKEQNSVIVKVKRDSFYDTGYKSERRFHMATTTRYGKPNMTGLPKDLGVQIFKTILATPAPDFEKMHKESMELERRMMEEREKRKNG